MKLDWQQAVPNSPLRILNVSAATSQTFQLPQGWCKLSIANYYGYNVLAVFMPADSATPNANPFSTPGLVCSTQGRTVTNSDPLEFYVDDSGKRWRLETYGLYALVATIDRIPAPIHARVHA